LGKLATNVVTQAEVAKRDAVHVFGGNNGRIEAVEHNVLGRREATRTLVAVITIATTGTIVAVFAGTSGTWPVIAVATEGAVALGTVRARTIGSWTLVTVEPRGAALIPIGASCGTAVIAVIAGAVRPRAVVAKTIGAWTFVAATGRAVSAVSPAVVARLAVVATTAVRASTVTVTTGAPLITSTALTTVIAVARFSTIAKFSRSTLGARAAGCARVAFSSTGAGTLVAIVTRGAAIITSTVITVTLVARTGIAACLGGATRGCTRSHAAARGSLGAARTSAKARCRTLAGFCRVRGSRAGRFVSRLGLFRGKPGIKVFGRTSTRGRFGHDELLSYEYAMRVSAAKQWLRSRPT
jgi:hypothetical protein